MPRPTRPRRHAALLRARGATPRQLRRVFIGATALTALAGALIGALIGVLLASLRFGSELAASDPVGAILRAVIIAVIAATGLATAAAAFPLREQLRQEVATGRQELQRVRAPLWQRLCLDVLAIVAAIIVYYVVGSGIHPVIGVEGNPTVTIALTSFLAPMLLWTGGTLLLLRLSQRAMARSGRIAGWLERFLGPGGELAGRSLTARANSASRAIVVLALSVSFATSVLIFDATYRQQQRVDAQLTLGADLKIVPTQPTDTPAVAGLAGPGIATMTPFVDRIVYVGSEAQDLLAVDPATLPQVSTLADTFFRGISGADAMAALRSQPDGILVSDETAKDYSIVPGDRVRIRVPDVNGNLVQVDFRMVGIALEFPTAPKDAFLVANQAFVASQTGNNRISYALARASGDPTDVAKSLGARLGSGWQVADLGATNARLANTITSVDLADLVLLDLIFAVLIAAVGAALFLLAGLVERRRRAGYHRGDRRRAPPAPGHDRRRGDRHWGERPDHRRPQRGRGGLYVASDHGRALRPTRRLPDRADSGPAGRRAGGCDGAGASRIRRRPCPFPLACARVAARALRGAQAVCWGSRSAAREPRNASCRSAGPSERRC